MRVLVVGAGFTGAVIARELSTDGHQVLVIDERDHVAGNCHTQRDNQTGIMLHVYGPHIFHTDNEEVWKYITSFGEMMPYVNRVKATVDNKVYSLPINLHTINQFFEKSMTPSEAREFVRDLTTDFDRDPETFEEQAMAFVGDRLYEAFFLGYTKKQWGVEPSSLPASILKRLPLRFNYNDNYFSHKYQGMPKDGYTKIIESILDTSNLEVRLQFKYEDLRESFDHVVYTGPLDRYFDHKFGRLGYRSLEFEEIRDHGDFQGTAVMNYCDEDVPYTRISEHKHFAPWEVEKFDETVCFKEFSKACGPNDIPYYPIRLVNDKQLLSKYVELAQKTQNVTFAGRLATYSYIDMDVSIDRALETSKLLLSSFKNDNPCPIFLNDPL